MTKNEKQFVDNIRIRLLYHRKTVFSGELKDLPKLIAKDQPADRVKLYGDNGAVVASMKYRDLKAMVGDNTLG